MAVEISTPAASFVLLLSWLNKSALAPCLELAAFPWESVCICAPFPFAALFFLFPQLRCQRLIRINSRALCSQLHWALSPQQLVLPLSHCYLKQASCSPGRLFGSRQLFSPTDHVSMVTICCGTDRHTTTHIVIQSHKKQKFIILFYYSYTSSQLL